jgi:uncharacterized protein
MAKKEPATWEHTRIFLRPIASGVPLGFFSFAVGMLMLGALATGLIPVGQTKDVGLILVLFSFPLEILATIFAFLARDSMSAATFGLFAAKWLTLGTFELIARPGSTSVALGVYYFGFVASLLMIGAIAVKSKPFYTVLLAVAAARLIVAGIYETGGSHFFYTLSGYLAFAVMLITFYGGIAFTLEDMHQKPILPLFRRGTADEAFRGYEKQLERLEAEPGIRHQL